MTKLIKQLRSNFISSLRMLNFEVKALVILSHLLFPLSIQAQSTAPAWIEDVLYSTGKYNTVAAVVGIILLGIGIWLFMQDRKLSELEKKINGGTGPFDRT